MSGVVDNQVLSDIIGSVYDCALDPNLWTPTLETLRGELDFANASLSANLLPSGDPLFEVVVGVDDPWRRRMNEYAADILEMWGGPEQVGRYPLYEPFAHSQLFPREHLDTNRYYQEWARPQGIEDGVGMVFVRDAGLIGSLGLGRFASSGNVTQRELSALRLLAPHFRRALTISRLLDLQTLRAASFGAALDAVAAGVVFVDAAMRTVFANRAAQAMLTAGDIIEDRNGVLVIAAAARRVSQGVAAILRKSGQIDPADAEIAIRLDDGRTALLHLLPLADSATRSALEHQAVMAIFITMSGAGDTAPLEAISAIYNLTPAESQVASLLSEGLSRVEIAQRTGVAISTVKTHLSQLLLKTGCRRQGELIALLATLRPPIRRQAGGTSVR